MLRDADASVAVTVEGYRYSTAANAMRTRIYSVMRDVRRDHGFCSIVTSPSDSPDLKPRVNWAAFHETVKLSSVEGEETGYGGGGRARGVTFAQPSVAAPPPSSSTAPSSAVAANAASASPAIQQQQAAARTSNNLHRNSMDVLRSDAARQATGAGAGGVGGGAAANAAAASAPPPPSSSARPPAAVTASFTAAAAAAAAATAEATRAPPFEAGGGMLLPPGLDPDSTFRLRSAAAQGARARADSSMFEKDEDEAPPEGAEWRGIDPNPVSLAVRRFSSSSSPKRRSEGGEGAV